MIANYHSHTTRCFHAVGTETEYLDAAVKRGLKIFGFSDHAPQWYPEGHSSRIRMATDQLEEYCQCIRQLQAQYKGKLEIPLGLEVEFYPDLFDALHDHAQAAGVEYLLLGQHWCGNEVGEIYNGRPTEDPTALKRYTQQCIQAMETGLFTYLAHPDLMHFVGDPGVYKTYMRALCKAAIATETPVEINLLGLLNDRHYPNRLFWEVAAEEGCQAVLGIDAHAPEEILASEPEKKALEWVSALGLKLLDTVPFKKI